MSVKLHKNNRVDVLGRGKLTCQIWNLWSFVVLISWIQSFQSLTSNDLGTVIKTIGFLYSLWGSYRDMPNIKYKICGGWHFSDNQKLGQQYNPQPHYSRLCNIWSKYNQVWYHKFPCLCTLQSGKSNWKGMVPTFVLTQIYLDYYWHTFILYYTSWIQKWPWRHWQEQFFTKNSPPTSSIIFI